MKNGQRVMLITPLPRYDSIKYEIPIVGSIGTIECEIDNDDDYYVLFDKYSQNDLEPFWFVHKSRIVPINMHDKAITKHITLTLSTGRRVKLTTRRRLASGKAKIA